MNEEEEEGKRAAVLNVLRQKFREITIRENDLRRKVADARSETITTRCVFLSILQSRSLSQTAHTLKYGVKKKQKRDASFGEQNRDM